MSKETKILIGIVALVVVVMGGVFALGNSGSSKPPTANNQNLVHDTSHKQGSGSVTMVEFGDYQCPACGAAYPSIKKIQSDYSGKVALVFRNYPLPMHPNAPMAAEAAEAAGAQGKYWEMHDKLYETQKDWAGLQNPLDTFVGYAQGLGINVDTFRQDVQANKYANVISADKSDGDALSLTGTPTIYVNGVQATSYDYNTLKAAVDQALKG